MPTNLRASESWRGGERERDKTVLKAIRKLNSVSQKDGVAAIKVRVLQGMLLKRRIEKKKIQFFTVIW
jgi:hypothetical protein